MRNSIRDGGCWGAMVGLGENYIPAFALAAGLSEVTAGWVASLPILAGGLLQTLSLRAIPLVGSYQRWIAISCTIQGLAFFPLMIAAWTGYIYTPMLFFLASVYWGGGLGAGPAWNTWMGQIVPSALRPRFFAIRSRTNQLCTLTGFLIGGLILHYARHQDRLLIGFGLLFLMAGIFRLASVMLLLRHRAEDPIHRDTISAGKESRSKRSLGGNASIVSLDSHPSRHNADVARGYRLVLFLAIVQGMVQFSGPYFTPYMLKQLSFSYTAFVALFSASFIAKALSMSLWGWFARRHGARALLWTGAISIVPLAGLWNVSDSFAWLLLVQAASGTAWAAYELGFFLMFFDTLPNNQRTKMLTVYNLANTSAWFCGSLLGGWYLTTCGATPAAYQTIFAISTLGRFAALLLLWNVDRPLLVPCSLFLRYVHSNVMAILVREKSLGHAAMERTIYAFTQPVNPQTAAITASASDETPASIPLTSIPLPVTQMMPDSDGLSDNSLQAA
ncbi:MAG: hypothetical protein RLY14_2258 [Planctomycetota bacterium]